MTLNDLEIEQKRMLNVIDALKKKVKKESRDVSMHVYSENIFGVLFEKIEFSIEMKEKGKVILNG
jgi:hypothetical protein